MKASLSGFLLVLFITACTAPPRYDDAPAPAPVVTTPVTTTAAYQTQLATLLEAGRLDEAQWYADAIDVASLSAPEQNMLHLAYAQIHLSRGEAEQALQRLDLVKVALLADTQQKSYYQARAFALSLTGALLDSAKARIALTAHLTNEDARHSNFAAILETLSLLPPASLDVAEAGAEPTLAGWLQLTRLFRETPRGHPALPAKIATWRARFATHPAVAWVAGLSAPHAALPMPTLSQPPRRIALLLPEEGEFAQAARALREGFMAAFYHQDNGGYQPAVRFYNTSSAEPTVLYDRAIADGAQLVVGPLDKAQIQMLAQLPELPVPILALNHVPGIARAGLYQFALSPIDDAEQLAAKAWNDGHQRAWIVALDNELGQRLSQYFRSAWEARDGVVVKTLFYDPRQNDLQATIPRWFDNPSEGAERSDSGDRAIAVSSPPSAADFIFLIALPEKARQIVAFLRYAQPQALSLPIYAPAHVYAGLPDAQADSDLDGVVFCDIPWLFPEGYAGELSLNTLQQLWQQFPRSYLRLIAMGLDSFNLLPHLDKLDSVQYAGATGRLLLDAERRITRQLFCARFAGGVPQALGFTPTASAPPAMPSSRDTETR